MKPFCNIGTVVMCCVFLLFGLCIAAFSQDVPDEARRYFNRGMAAVEIASGQDGYELAIDEFRQAAALAPEWSDAYYNLGLVQEKAGRYRDAANALRRYLQLAPNAPDASEVRMLADKLEFMADQHLSEEDVLAIYVSLTDRAKWQARGISKVDLFDPQKWVSSIEKQGDNALKIIFPSGYCGFQGRMDQSVMLMGKKIEFGTVYCACEASTDPEMCAVGKRYFLEVVSKNKVKARMKYWYAKIVGGGTDEAVFEFIRH